MLDKNHEALETQKMQEYYKEANIEFKINVLRSDVNVLNKTFTPEKLE